MASQGCFSLRFFARGVFNRLPILLFQLLGYVNVGLALAALEPQSGNSLSVLPLDGYLCFAAAAAARALILGICCQGILICLQLNYVAAARADILFCSGFNFAVAAPGLAHNSLLALRAGLPENPHHNAAFSTLKRAPREIHALIHRFGLPESHAKNSAAAVI